MIKRRESRETAFTLLYEWSFTSNRTMDEMIELAVEHRGIVTDDYLLDILKKTTTNAEEIDGHIRAYSTKWKLNRISKVSLAALRLSIGEILYRADIPTAASINEAVELVKKFGAEDEPSYLNGVLGGYVRATDQEEN